MSTNKLHFETLAIHHGQEPDLLMGAVVPPLYLTSTFAHSDPGVTKGYDYSRSGNPTRTALESNLAALEGQNALSPAFGLAFSSGLAAIDTLLRLFQPGEHVLVSNDVYGGTYRLFERVFKPLGLKFSYVDISRPEVVAENLYPETRLVWLETPTNPLLKIVDIQELSAAVKAKNPKILVAVDNTFASPYLQQPLALGADFVVHSTTKYIGGHSDVIGGAIVTTLPEAYERLKFLQNATGPVPAPFDCWLTLRGIKTLAVRMETHSANARRIAGYLNEHAAVAEVLYPGLVSHPGYKIAKKQMRDFGGMISIILKGGAEAARQLVKNTRLFTLAESLGGVESLIEVPALMTHASVAGSALEVPAGLVRLSVGIENVNDLLQDLQDALKA
ncbi:MAG: cystathionine gamma-synthase [Anaerolineae bacterium]|nr:cystathionine gamma-synthase [Anaerolineae bacterium]